MPGLKNQKAASQVYAPLMSLELAGNKESSESSQLNFWSQLKHEDTVHLGQTFNSNEIFGIL
jgi:hypothetical protein